MSHLASDPVALAALGTGFTFLCTALGAAVVFFVRRELSPKLGLGFLGFASGVMMAASVWSLLIPAIEMAEEQGKTGWIPALGGFVLGGAFLFLLDRLLPHLHLGAREPEGPKSSFKRTTMLVFAVTLHNVPEGMAVGLAFALAATGEPGALTAAFALALGMGLQNFPEGAAISLPLHREGLGRGKAFFYGAASGFVEPVAGLIGVLLASTVTGIMPWMLAFAAGAMIYVVVEELIPQSQEGEHGHAGTFGAMAGFALMMVLDVALG
ncbi:ZIP family metal transporter [Bittarella massiliensis (ex Durand et al. 2017)]|uniref:ZIP family metal transporter n=1 Tax=Bittarella massiliensis (ex Durand et al. 2017) TaxID=1720313 RepID=UPI00073F1FC7|nr:ZIP family metal transporter [Bittarella massiliensis (ex Durand et al. 2017)]